MQYENVKQLADGILDGVKREMLGVQDPKALLILHAGNDPASAAYMRGKLKDCQRCGIPCEVKEAHSTAELEWFVKCGNDIDRYGGVIIQLPLPDGWDENVVELVDPEKDVDGFRAQSPFDPCTPGGIMDILLNHFGQDLRGLDVLLVGKGKLVGGPLVPMLMRFGCTVTVCGSHTKALENKLLRFHDAVITATGQGDLFDLEGINAELVIDATNVRGADGKLHGDCYGFDEHSCSTLHYTPVPGGVGLMTRAMLMRHMMEAQ